MTYEEAKNNIDKNLDCGDVNNLDSEALCMAIEALEKQTPKKPTFIAMDGFDAQVAKKPFTAIL